MSRCEDCYILVRETLLSLPASDEVAEAPPSASAPPSPARPFASRYLLPLAAMLVVGLGSAALWWQFWRDGHAAAVSDLVEAVGERRFFEARLTGGFRHGPLVGVKRAASSDNSDQWDVRGQAMRIVETEKRPSVETGRALAAAHLFNSKVGVFQADRDHPNPRADEVDAAIGILEGLAREHPKHARLQSDLAAAYLVRAEGSGQGDAQKAFDAASAAVQLDPTLREAHFNKALALESLQRRGEAIQAWESYPAAFPGDEWLPAVSAHLTRLRAEP